MIWFTADTHFGHTNIIRYCKRPFADAAAMDDALVEAWNARVSTKDEVWHLGDVCFGAPIEAILPRLRGRLHIVVGNHDTPSRLLPYALSVQDVKLLRVDRRPVFLSHYAHRVWPHSHHEGYHLYGHSHGTLPGSGLSMDVGVDAVPNYAPLAWEEVRERLMGRSSFTERAV